MEKSKVNKIINALMVLKDKSMSELAQHEGLELPSLRSRMNRSAHKTEDLISYAKFLGVDIGFKDGDNFYSFIDEGKK